MEQFSFVKARETEKSEWVKINSSLVPDIDTILLNKWQNWLDLVARLANIPAALIMKLNEKTIEVYLKSNSPGNPYHKNEEVLLGCGLYCENVIGTRQKLWIPDATTNPLWNTNNPDLDLNMVSYLGYPLYWPNGEVFGTVCILDNKANAFSNDMEDFLFNLKESIESDLELVVSKKTLSESEEKFRLLFNLSPQPILLTDYATGKIIDCNDKLLEYLGLGKNDIINKTTVELNFLSQPEREELLSEFESRDIASNFEISLVTPANEKIHFLLFAAKISLGGKYHLINNLLDITPIIRSHEDSKNKTDALALSEKQLRELNVTKDRFFSIIAHDLMDPFNALFGFSDILIEALKTKEYDNCLMHAETIRQSAERILNLLQNLLLWSRAQSGRIKFNPSTVKIKDLVNEIISVLQPSVQIKNLALEINIDNYLEAVIDNNIVTTVVRNLIMNAIKFTEIGGIITINAHISDNELTMSISDTGTGIHESLIDDLFRLDIKKTARGTDDETGTGMGLIISKEFVEIHKGRIWVNSEYGKGSTFSFAVPVDLT
jgi:two-component system, sensor histidine kinase and response regulator